MLERFEQASPDPVEDETSSKKEYVFEWKKEVVERLENVARAIAELKDLINENPDINVEDLKNKFYLRTKYAGLSRDDEEGVEAMIDRYAVLHKNIKQYRERFPDDGDLYAEVIGRKPKGKIKAIVGSYTISFLCYELEDYAAINSGKFKGELDKQDLELAACSDAVHNPLAGGEKLSGAIIAENCNTSWASEQLRKHEEQHAFHTFFWKPAMANSFVGDFSKEKDTNKRNQLLRRYCRYRREEIGEHRVAGEILAYKIQGLGNDEILENILRKKEDGGHHDYFDSAIKDIAKDFGTDQESKDIITDVFEKEYRQIILDAVNAFDELRLYAALTIDETIAFFSMLPIQRWKKFLKRREEFESGDHLRQWIRSKKDGHLWDEYDCVAEQFDKIGEVRPKQKNKKRTIPA